MAKAYPLSGIRKWLEREEWAGLFDELLENHLADPCEAAGIETEALPDVIGEVLSSTLFSCAFEAMLATEFDDGSNIVDDYLKRRGWKESVPNRRYMTALRSSVMSLYEISDIVRDQSFLARDVLRGGEPVRVSERLATRGMKPWDLVGLRLVPMGSRIEMAGGALPMRREVGERLREDFAGLRDEMRDDAREKRKPGEPEPDAYAFDTYVLRNAAFIFTHTWLDDILQACLDPVTPDLINGDGDTVVFTTVRYLLKPDTDRMALAEGIAAIPGFRAGTDDSWNWSEPPDAATPDGGSEQGKRLLTYLPDGSVSLGDVSLEGASLKLTTNSPQRADRARALLEPVIGAFVGEPAIESMTIEEMVEASPDAREAPRPTGLSEEEERAVLSETLDHHYRQVLDQPVPMLGDVSPRELAGAPAGRERVADWLKGLENANAHLEPNSAIAEYDTRWMWDELGIADLRR